MQTKTWDFCDKSSWPRGPWDNEPDKAQWPDQETGLPCLAVRNRSGNWCGYVGISEGHPLFNANCDSARDIDVHGGLTFADSCSGEEHGICHEVCPGENDRVWWLGFDCAHSGDLSPAYDKHGTYRDLDYVRGECASLARQLKNLA